MTARRAAKPSTGRTIEGEAVLIGRRRMEAPPPRPHEPAPTNDNEAATLPFPVHRRSRPDLLYPGAVRWPAVPRTGLRLRESRLLAKPRRSGLVAVAVLAIAAAGLTAVAWGDRAVPAPAAPVFALSDAASTVTQHSGGAVLSVAGRLRNLSARPAPAPAVSVAIAGAHRRTFRPSESVVAPGASVFFHSTLALPSATSGTKAVLSLEAAKGSTSRP